VLVLEIDVLGSGADAGNGMAHLVTFIQLLLVAPKMLLALHSYHHLKLLI
jgi:hypothetical protein